MPGATPPFVHSGVLMHHPIHSSLQIQAAQDHEESDPEAMEVDQAAEKCATPGENEPLPEGEDSENLICTEAISAEARPRVLTDDEMRGMAMDCRSAVGNRRHVCGRSLPT
jgi:hypothetical protein